MQKLTTGALMRFAKNSACGEQPILQVLNIRLMDSKSVSESSMTASQHKKAQRYRLILSDGKHFLPSCVLTVQLNELVLNGQLQEYSIIRLDRYLRSDLKGQTAKMILQILQLTVLDIATHRIGNPVSLLTADLNEEESSTTLTTKDVLQPKVTGSVLKRPPTVPITTNEQPVLPPPPSSIKTTTTITNDNDSIKNNRLFKIETLNPFQNRWTIRVRVAHKKPIRTFSNGEGRLFSCDLVDETGEIRATAFGDDCDRFESMIIVGNIYYVTQAQIKYANKQFNRLNNDFEMTFHNETIIEPCLEDIPTIPKQRLHFISINQIQNMENNSFIDVIGIILSASDLIHGKSKQNKEYTKRDILITDRTGQITVTLWYQMAESFQTSIHRAVLMLKGACVNDFNGGRTLSVLSSTQLELDPDLPIVHDLRRWYLEEGINIEMTDLTIQLNNHENNFPWKTFAQLAEYDSNLLSSTNGEIFRIKAVCAHVRRDPVYQACTRSDCKKKLQDNNDGTYYCSKCDLNYEDYKLLYMASILLADSTGYQWVGFFDKECELLFGCSSEQFPYGKTKDDEDKAYQKLMSVVGKEKFFIIRVKANRYNNHDRLQYTCIGIENIDPCLMSRLYLEDIGRMCQILLK